MRIRRIKKLLLQKERTLLSLYFLVLVASAATATTSTLKLPSLAADIRLGVGVGYTRSSAKVLDGLTSVLRAAEEDSITASRSDESELIKGNDLTASLEDASASSLSNAQGADPELGEIKETDIVSDSSHKDSNLVLLALHELSQLGQRQRGPIDLGHKEALEHHLVEVRLGTADHEAVQLQKQRTKGTKMSDGLNIEVHNQVLAISCQFPAATI